MELDHLFWIALQSSFLLGLIHGINPCGHSWLVLAPFVVGTRDGRKVSFLTISFLAGTAAACLILGLTLGVVSQAIPAGFQRWVELATSAALVILGLILVLRPHLLHHHDHDHDDHQHSHQHDHDTDHGHDRHDAGHDLAAACRVTPSTRQKMTGTALFGIGFVNMVIPCPTLAVMYGYALDSGSYLKAGAVFGIYAVSTGLAVGAVIYGIHKVTGLLKTLCQNWVEGAIMRTAGVMTIFFGVYTLLQHM